MAYLLSNGVYFVNQETQKRTKVEPSDIVSNNPSELIIVIPNLAAGIYNLAVVTQYSGSSTPLKETRKRVYEKTFTVQ
jgi:hypothetical protein